MRISSPYKTSFRPLRGQAVLALAALVLGGLFASHASAQFLTHDVENDENNFAQTITQYGKELDHYQSVISHYQQQLISLQKMNFSIPGLQNGFTEISPSDAANQVSQACPGTTGDIPIVGGLLQMFTPSMNQPVTATQLQICQQITLRKIDKYNLTVKMLNRLNGTYSPNLQSIYSQMTGAGTEQGKMDGAKANVQSNTNALETEVAQWRGQIDTDDQIINYLEYQQQYMAKVALDGNNTILGNVVQAAALKLAFENLTSGLGGQ